MAMRVRDDVHGNFSTLFFGGEMKLDKYKQYDPGNLAEYTVEELLDYVKDELQDAHDHYESQWNDLVIEVREYVKDVEANTHALLHLTAPSV